MYGVDGWKGGYGWKMNEIVATQVVYVPVSEAFRAEHGVGAKVIGSIVILSLLGGAICLLLVLRRA